MEPTIASCLKDSKCILHIDLDCFYAQVEEVRLGLDSSKPVGVQQWQNLIAVNYAARRYGVSRHCSVEEAKKLCPEITLVHVATYAPNETTAHYHDNPSRSTHKVSLDAYRDAGKKVFKIFTQHCALLQKVGSDEAFLDVTETVNRSLENYISNNPVLRDQLCLDSGSTFVIDNFRLEWKERDHVIRSAEEERYKKSQDASVDSDNAVYQDPTSWFDLQLYIAADLAAAIRQQIYDELHYTCSAGIAHNKVLAKLGSSMNKPNKQTVLRQHIALEFMHDIPFNKIRNLGGKLGQAVEEEYKIQKASELWPYPLEELQQKFGESTGLWLFNIVRGIDHEEVILLKAPKSLMASKTIQPPIWNERELSPWYGVLAGELHNRVMTNYKEQRAWPKTLSVCYRTVNDPNVRSKSMPMLHKSEFVTSVKLQEKVTAMFKTFSDVMFPCNLVALRATGVVADESTTNHTINSFFITQSNKSDNADINSHEDQHPDSVSSNTGCSSSIAQCFTNQATLEKVEPKKSSSASSLSSSSTSSSSAKTVTSPLARFFSNQEGQTKGETNTIIPNQSLSSLQSQLPASITSWTCDRCHQSVALELVDEHTDYHFALDLEKEGRQTGTRLHQVEACHTSNNHGEKRKDRRESITKKLDKKPKNLFFRPSPS